MWHFFFFMLVRLLKGMKLEDFSSSSNLCRLFTQISYIYMSVYFFFFFVGRSQWTRLMEETLVAAFRRHKDEYDKEFTKVAVWRTIAVVFNAAIVKHLAEEKGCNTLAFTPQSGLQLSKKWDGLLSRYVIFYIQHGCHIGANLRICANLEGQNCALAQFFGGKKIVFLSRGLFFIMTRGATHATSETHQR